MAFVKKTIKKKIKKIELQIHKTKNAERKIGKEKNSQF